MQVYDLIADESVAIATAFGGNLGFGPPYGTLNVQDSALLLAGGEYAIGYSTLIDHFDPTPPGTNGEGSGEVHFSLTPVPEPATLGLFAFAFLISRRRY